MKVQYSFLASIPSESLCNMNLGIFCINKKSPFKLVGSHDLPFGCPSENETRDQGGINVLVDIIHCVQKTLKF